MSFSASDGKMSCVLALFCIGDLSGVRNAAASAKAIRMPKPATTDAIAMRFKRFTRGVGARKSIGGALSGGT